MKKLVQLPDLDVWVNPIHVVYVREYIPTKGERAVEVCYTMYGRYSTILVRNKTVEEVAAIINGN